jgi:iron complex outermembrane receptor protein
MTATTLRQLMLTGATAAAFLGIASPGWAQQAPSAEPASLDEVIVTAQKRSQRLQDVPLAVTALSAETLSSSQVTGTAGLSSLVPSLTYTQSTNDLNNNVRIRGVGTALFNTGLESAVSFVVDGVVMSRQGQGFQELIDVERVEVLRGPQGTLFGKNATAGVIHIVTQRPSAEPEGVLEASAAEHGEYRLRGSYSAPISDAVGVRLTGFYTDDEGYIYDHGRGENVYGAETWGLRGKLDWQATPDLNFLLTADYRTSDTDCCQPVPYLTTNTVLADLRAPVVASPTNRSVESDGNTFMTTEQQGVSLQGDLSLGDHTLTSITAYRTWNLENNVDVDGWAGTVPVYVPFGNGYFSINGGGLDIAQFTQELRLTSPSGGPLEYTVGLFYFDLDLDRDFVRRTGACLTNPAAFGQPCPTFVFRSAAHEASSQTENIALFGQAEWQVTEALSAIAGFRAQRETVSYSGERGTTPPFAGDQLLFTANVGSGEITDEDVSGKVGLQYQFSRRAQTYLTWTRGYKGAGYDVELTANFATQTPVLPETVEAWELGFKGQLFDGRMSLNTALFRADYENLQVQSTIAPNVSIPTNAGSSISQGAEVEVQIAASDNLSLSFGATWLDAHFDANRIACSLPAQAAPVTLAVGQPEPINTCFRLGAGTVQNVRGGDLPNAPEWRTNASIRYENDIPDTGLAGFGQLTFTSQTKTTFSLEQDPGLTQDGYSLVNLSMGVRTQDDRYQLTFFVRNLFDEHFVNGLQRDNMITNAANPGNILYFPAKDAERYAGLTFRANF